MAQSVVEIRDEHGLTVLQLEGTSDSLLLWIDQLPRSRYIVSISNTNHSDTALANMSLRCLFNDAFCQQSDPLAPDSIYEAEGFYDGHWISIDRHGNHARILWEKHVLGGFLHGMCLIYGSKGVPVYVANFSAGLLDGIAARYDYKSGYYSCSLYKSGKKVRAVNWAADGRLFFDTVWKPVLPP